MKTQELEDRFERFRRDGDARALAAVFDETAPDLLRLARHLVRGRDAEDLVQATFLLAIEKRASFDASRRLRPWLTGILVREAIATRRTLAREVDPARLGERVSTDPRALAESREMSQAVVAALAKLSINDREVLIPLLFDGRRAVEIARELGRRPEAIQMRVHRGLARLRRLLPASVALGLTRIAHSAELARARAAVLEHARRELGLAASAAAPFVLLGGVMSIAKVGLAAAALVLALVAVRGASRLVAGVGEHEVTPLSAGASSEARERRGVDVDVELDEGDTAPADERVPASPGEPNALEIEVVLADGEPAFHADVVLVRADSPRVETGLDEHGRATFVAGAGEGELFVRRRAAFPHRARIPLAAGRVRIELPRGEELSGRLLERDGSPVAGLELSITTDFDPPSFADAPFRELGLTNADSSWLVAYAVTGAGGSFRFTGLPEGWSGELELLGGCLFVEGGAPTASNRQWFPESGAGLELTCALRPRITGRLLESGSRRALAHHEIDARIGWRNGDVTAHHGLTDRSGRFEIVLGGASPAVSFQIMSTRDPYGRSSDSTEELRWDGVADVRDLGDVEVTLEPARPLAFAVCDGAGKPIAGARIAFDSGGIAACDSTGIASVEAVPRSVTRASAAAPGHAVARIEFDAEFDAPVEIVLLPTNELTVALPTGVEPHTFRLEILSSAPLFGECAWAYPQGLRGAMIGDFLGASEGSDGHAGSTSFAFADDGRLVLEGIIARAPFRLAVEDELERVVFEVDCEPMRADERRLVQVELRSDSFDDGPTIRGRVVDRLGRGLRGARVGDRRRTGSNGRFSLLTDAGGQSSLVVRKRGYAPATLDLASAPGSEVVVVLQRGRDVEVRVVDTSGEPVEDAIVLTELEGIGEVVAERDPSGRRHFLLDLPEFPLVVSTEIGGRAYAVRVEPTDCTATIEVPEHGRVEVAWSLPPDVPPGSELRIVLQPPGDPGNAIQIRELARFAVEHVLPHVQPGEYELILARRSQPEELPGHWAVVHGPLRVRVGPGTTQRVELR